jgi:hypothetical protein
MEATHTRDEQEQAPDLEAQLDNALEQARMLLEAHPPATDGREGSTEEHAAYTIRRLVKLLTRRPDAIRIETWTHPDSEPDEMTWTFDDDEDVEKERLLAVREAVRYATTPPHRCTSRLVYYGPPQVHKFEVRQKSEAPACRACGYPVDDGKSCPEMPDGGHVPFEAQDRRKDSRRSEG